jgi:hypothetical protein
MQLFSKGPMTANRLRKSRVVDPAMARRRQIRARWHLAACILFAASAFLSATLHIGWNATLWSAVLTGLGGLMVGSAMADLRDAHYRRVLADLRADLRYEAEASG